MKVLTMCQGGNSRSVGCGYLLKYFYGMDAIACSWEKNSEETLKMLFKWADKIIVMEAYMTTHVPKAYLSKVITLDVGPDIWSNSLHPDLLNKVDALLKPMMVEVKA